MLNDEYFMITNSIFQPRNFTHHDTLQLKTAANRAPFVL